MINSVWAIVKQGRIEPLETIEVPEGTKALVTLLPDDEESKFWLGASQTALDKIWNNTEDDIYANGIDFRSRSNIIK